MEQDQFPVVLAGHVVRIKQAMAQEGIRERKPLEAVLRLVDALEGGSQAEAEEARQKCRECLKGFLDTAPPWKSGYIESLEALNRALLS